MPKTAGASRRSFLKRSLAFGSVAGISGLSLRRAAPAILVSDDERPVVSHGLQIGDVLQDHAVIWSRADRAALLRVEWSRDEDFSRSVLVRGPHALDVRGVTGRVAPAALPPDTQRPPRL